MRVTQSGVTNIETLEAMAKARFGLLCCARWLHWGVIEKRAVLRRFADVRKLYATAEKLCIERKWAL